MLGSFTSLLILQISSCASLVTSIIGVKNLDGILGTDIFWSDGFVSAAAALLGAIVVMTVIGLIFPLELAPSKLPLREYYPGPGISSVCLPTCSVVTRL